MTHKLVMNPISVKKSLSAKIAIKTGIVKVQSSDGCSIRRRGITYMRIRSLTTKNCRVPYSARGMYDIPLSLKVFAKSTQNGN
jgi:hypothetical protein